MAAEQDEQKPEDLREALDTANNQRFFRVLEGEDDLKAMLARPLDKWRVSCIQRSGKSSTRIILALLVLLAALVQVRPL